MAATKRKNIEKLKKERAKAKKMSLDDIENEMEEIAMNTDISKVFICSQRMDMLEKVANFKIKRMQLQLEQEKAENTTTTTEPIKLEIVKADSSEQENRINKIDKEILEEKGINQDA